MGTTVVNEIGTAHLVITNPQGEKRVDLAAGYMWKVGRDAGNDIVIASNVVSRQHAMLQRAEDGVFYLIDMGSLNGSCVNGHRVSVPAALTDGDRISLGDTVIAFHRNATGATRAMPTRAISDEATAAYFLSNRITVLVVDVRNFTGLTQQIGESLLCQFIGTWFREAGPLLNARGSWAQKYIGDAIMSIWVHKHGMGDREIVRALRALEELVHMTATLQNRFDLPEPIRIGAGINTGLATIGNAAGSGSLTDYTALGDTVNATFRLETATKGAGVDLLLGKESFGWLGQIAKPEPYFEQRIVSLKGYDQPVEAWGAKFADLDKFVGALAPEK
jgi:adenylate cyclase